MPRQSENSVGIGVIVGVAILTLVVLVALTMMWHPRGDFHAPNAQASQEHAPGPLATDTAPAPPATRR